MSNNSLIQQVQEAVKGLLVEVATHPLCHFSEKSLQIRLASKLLNIPELGTPRPTSIGQRYQSELKLIQNEEKRTIGNYHGEAYKTTPFQMEYGCNLSGPYRIDIAVLNPEEMQKIVTPQLQDASGKYLKPLVGVEFGTEKIGWKNMSGKHLENDAKKVAECVNGYVINVMRNTNFGSRSGGRHADKLLRIGKFKQAVAEYANKSSHVMWLGMVIHVALAEVEFFKADKSWATFDLSQGVGTFEQAVAEKLGIHMSAVEQPPTGTT